VAHLGRHDRLRAGAERGVAHGDLLVVLEGPALVLDAERRAAQVQREQQVGLLDDLAPVDLEVREVQHQRVLGAVGPLEVPLLVPGEPRRLRVHLQVVVVRDEHGLGRGAPGRDLVVVELELVPPVALPLRHGGCRHQVALRHQVGEDVVVGERAVLVRAGHAVDAERTAALVVAQRQPQPRGLHEELEGHLLLEALVAGGVEVAHGGVGDVGVDVEGRPCPRASSRCTPRR
jgi:hypothetical protein